MLQLLFKWSVVLILSWSTSCSAALCVKPLLVGFESWAPYQYFDKSKRNMPATGFDAEFIRKVALDLGCEVTFVAMPWNRQQLSVETGSLDIALAAMPTAERNRYAYFSIPYRNEVVKLYLAPKHQKLAIENIAELPNLGLLLGTELGFFYGEEFLQLMENHEFALNVRPVAGVAINVNRLLSQQIDGFLAEEKVADKFIAKRNYNNKIFKHSFVLHDAEVHIMVSKATGNRKFMNKLNAAMEKFLADDAYLELENKFLR